MNPTADSEFASTNRVVHLEDRRMAVRERGELATQAISAFTLLDAARAAYSLQGVDAFLLLNAVAGVALGLAVIMGVLKMRRHRDASSSGVNLVGVLGGVAMIVEGVHKLHSADFTFGHKHFALGVLTVLVGIMTGAISMVMERLEKRRVLGISDDGVRMRLNRFRRFDVEWAELTEIVVDAGQARLICTTGRVRTVPLARLVNRDEVRDALLEAARARGVSVAVPGGS